MSAAFLAELSCSGKVAPRPSVAARQQMASEETQLELNRSALQSAQIGDPAIYSYQKRDG